MGKNKNVAWYSRWWGIIIIILMVWFLSNSLTRYISTGYFDSSIGILTDNNYEILDMGYNDISKESPNYDPDGTIRDFAYIEMKGFGAREDQVTRGYIYLENKYESASEYNVVIYTEDSRCSYRVDGGIYRAWSYGLENYLSTENPTLMKKSEIAKKFDYQLWASLLLSQAEKVLNGEIVEEEDKVISDYMLIEEIEKLENEDVDMRTLGHIVQHYTDDGFCE